MPVVTAFGAVGGGVGVVGDADPRLRNDALRFGSALAD